jgi:hypothetical protein
MNNSVSVIIPCYNGGEAAATKLLEPFRAVGPMVDFLHDMPLAAFNSAFDGLFPAGFQDYWKADYVNEVMDSLKLPATRSMRKILRGGTAGEGWSKAGEIEENKRFGIGSSTPKEMVTLLEALYKETVISPAASKSILEVMKRQQFKTGIGRRFDDRTPVMSKSGSLDTLRSDTGLIFAPVGKFAISITVDDMPVKDYSPDNVGSLLISELTGYLLAGLGK